MGAAPLYLTWLGYNQPAWVLLGATLELMTGGRVSRYHPSRLIGRMVLSLAAGLAKVVQGQTGQRVVGGFLAVSVALAVLGIMTGLLWMSHAASIWAYRALVVIFTYWGLTMRGVTDAALSVYGRMARNQWNEARHQLALIVGRDTMHLSQREVVRSTVESLAERTCVKVLAPLLFVFAGGPAWLWLYKTVDIMDVVLRERHPEYRNLGWLATHMHDWLTFVPARLSGLAIAVAAAAEGRFRTAYEVMRSDGRRHPKPNVGISEAAMAGALGVSLGGSDPHGRVVALRPRVGRSERPLNPAIIVRAVSLTYRAALFMALWLSVMVVFVSGHWF